MKKYLVVLITVCMANTLSAQTDSTESRKPIEFDILYNYYSQDGDQSAVTGGRGTEELYNNDTQLSLFVPFKKGRTLNVLLGVDYYTSASTLEINKYVSSASTGTSEVSREDIRSYINVKYGTENFEKIDNFSVNLGFSNEFDVVSFNGGFGFKKKLKKGRSLSWNSSLFLDRWSLIYPGEFDENGKFTGTDGGYGSYGSYGGGSSSAGSSGSVSTGGGSTGGGSTGSGSTGSGSSGGSGSGSGSGLWTGNGTSSVESFWLKDSGSSYGESYGESTTTNDYDTDDRYSINNALSIKQIINKRMNITFVGEFNLQFGLLSTPFHRAYFDDGVDVEVNKLVAIENLPRQRLKGVLGAHYNYFFSKKVLLKLSYRTYYDSWNLLGQTAQITFPFKIKRSLTMYPFYRFHYQSGLKYYDDYGRHDIGNRYYTSDPDLDDLTSNKVGLGVSFHPLNGILTTKKIEYKEQFSFKSIDVRYAYYDRSNGLTAHSFSVGLSFKF